MKQLLRDNSGKDLGSMQKNSKKKVKRTLSRADSGATSRENLNDTSNASLNMANLKENQIHTQKD